MLEIQRRYVFTGHKGAIYTLLRDPENAHGFLSGGGDGWITAWDLQEPSEGRLRAKLENNKIFCLRSSGREEGLIAGTFEGEVFQISGEEIIRVRHHIKAVFDLIVRENDFLSFSGDGCFSQWERGAKKATQSFRLNYEGLRSGLQTPDALFTGSSNGELFRIDPQTFKVTKRLPDAHAGSIFSMRWLEEKGSLITGSMDAQLKVWDSELQLKKTIPAHMYTINSMECIPELNILATGSRDKTIKLWSLPEFELLKVLNAEKYNGHRHSVNTLLWMPGSNALVSAGDDRQIIVWSIEKT